MKLILGLVLGLSLGLSVPALASSSSTPPAIGEPVPSSLPGCWKYQLDRHTERQNYTLSGHHFVRFRTVSTYLRWCDDDTWQVVTWRGAWRLPRR